MIVVFDVDGVLIDTHEQVRESYARCGVIMPPDGFTLSWREWLPRETADDDAATHIHWRKNRIYPHVLRELPPKVLPAGRMLREYTGAGLDMYAVTSGSEEAVTAALESSGLGFVVVLGFELNEVEKNEILSNKFPSPGVYVDDNGSFKLSAKGWRFVHYTTQSYPLLVEDIWHAVSLVGTEE